jgi:hypothetical protein
MYKGDYEIDHTKTSLTILLTSASARCRAPPSPILFFWRLRVVSVYIYVYWWLWNPSEEKLSNHVVVQCLSQMPCAFRTDIVKFKIESGECLYWCIMVTMISIRKKVLSPYCYAMLQPDIVHLHHGYRCPQDWEWWLPTLMYKGDYEIHYTKTCLTILLTSASARCRAPSSPIFFFWKLRVVSVYIYV